MICTSDIAFKNHFSFLPVANAEKVLRLSLTHASTKQRLLLTITEGKIAPAALLIFGEKGNVRFSEGQKWRREVVQSRVVDWTEQLKRAEIALDGDIDRLALNSEELERSTHDFAKISRHSKLLSIVFELQAIWENRKELFLIFSCSKSSIAELAEMGPLLERVKRIDGQFEEVLGLAGLVKYLRPIREFLAKHTPGPARCPEIIRWASCQEYFLKYLTQRIHPQKSISDTLKQVKIFLDQAKMAPATPIPSPPVRTTIQTPIQTSQVLRLHRIMPSRVHSVGFKNLLDAGDAQRPLALQVNFIDREHEPKEDNCLIRRISQPSVLSQLRQKEPLQKATSWPQLFHKLFLALLPPDLKVDGRRFIDSFSTFLSNASKEDLGNANLVLHKFKEWMLKGAQKSLLFEYSDLFIKQMWLVGGYVDDMEAIWFRLHTHQWQTGQEHELVFREVLPQDLDYLFGLAETVFENKKLKEAFANSKQ